MTSLADMITGSPTVAPVNPVQPVVLDDIEDIPTLRQNIFDKVQSAAVQRFPVENSRYRIELGDVKYKKPKTFNKRDQKTALLKQQNLDWALEGTWKMFDRESGDLIDERRETVARVPYLTERGTFIRRGNEYTVANQSRLKPGVYTRRQQSGELETHFNVLEGGRSFRIQMDPKTSKFNIVIGQSKRNLTPVLRAMGVNDAAMKKLWGVELYNRNADFKPDDAKEVLQRLGGGRDPDVTMAQMFDKMQLDPDVTKITLGESHTNVSPDTLLAATRKLIDVSRGQATEDDRDSMQFQSIMWPDDLLSERIAKDYDRRIRGKLLWMSTRNNKLATQPGYLTRQIDSVFTNSGLAQPLEEMNPIEIMDQRYRVLRTGEGGISETGIPMECFDDQTEVFTREGWVHWPDVTPDTELACNGTGCMEYSKPYKLISRKYTGLMYGIHTRVLDLLVTPEHRMWTQKYRGGSSKKRCGPAPWEFELAKDGYRKGRTFMISHGAYQGRSTVDEIDLPFIKGQRTAYSFDLDDWAELVGWFVSEGGIDSYALRERKKFHITISQSDVNGENVDRIECLLSRMGIPNSRQAHNFVFVSKQIGIALAKFGTHALNKTLTEDVFDWPGHARERLLEAMCLGDGHYQKCGHATYHSTSRQLRDQFVRLAITLGYAARPTATRYHKNPKHNTCYSATVLTSKTAGVTSEQRYDEAYYKTNYDGFVYCAQVPGERLLVRRNDSAPVWTGNSRNVQPSHFGFIDPVRSPESGRVGVDARMAIKTLRGSDGQMYTMLKDSTGKKIPVSARDAATSIVAFPGELAKPGRRVRAMVRGKLDYVDRKEVNYELPHASHMFTMGVNFIPMVSATAGPRALMGGKFYNQALPLRNPEAPLVQALTDDGKTSFEEQYGTSAGATRSDVDGRVTRVGKDDITIMTPQGSKKIDIYDNLPFNRKTFLHSTPTVKVGDHVKDGDLLAHSNFTDDKGTLAMGKNLNVAYMSWKGQNYEDAVVISESAANKLSSEHMYPIKVENDTHTQRGVKEYVSLYPTTFDKSQLGKMDDDGVIKAGQTVKSGDPLVLAVRQKPVTDIYRGHKPGWMDAAETWDHEADGVVTDVERTRKGVRISVKAFAPMQVGDKIVGRFGDKGTVSEIVSDEKMPRNQKGDPLEVILNPVGVVTRTNPAQIMETALSRIAEKTGKPYKISGFADESLIDKVQAELKKHGLKDTEELSDPQSNRKFKEILTGKRFLMKLHHTSEAKATARGTGSYTMEDQPSRGGEHGAKRIGVWDINALLSHGATEVLKDAKTVRGQKNDDFWKAFQMGYTPPSPDVPLVYEKFLAHLIGSGVNVRKSGSQLNVMAMTDKDIDKLSRGEIKMPSGVDMATMREIPGGLFDKSLTGGHNGRNWTHITLEEPMPNPVMEEPIRRLLGLTKKDFESVLYGTKKLHDYTGSKAISESLARLRLPELKRLHEQIVSTGAKSRRDNSIKVLRYIDMMGKTGLKPTDFMMKRVPVIPPLFRPISATSDFVIKTDVNSLYVDLLKTNEALKEIKGEFGPTKAGQERVNLYKSFKAVTGLGDPINPKLVNQGVRGLLGQVFGTRPKFGMFQRRVLGGSLDTSGRAVISPNSSLDMDHVGVPEDMSWELFRPFTIRRLVRSGMGKVDAVRSVMKKTDIARSAMMDEMKRRPVIINRAPTLHKYNLMASYAVPVKGNTIQVSPVITPGFNADFDGDTMQIHVPVSDKAVEQARHTMVPSKNLFATSDFDVHYLPTQEYIYGLNMASKAKSGKRPTVFASKDAAIAAYKRGEIQLGDPIRISSVRPEKARS